MVAEDVASRMAEQLNVVVERARELFVDLVEEHARDGKIDVGPISESDKRVMERLFSEVVYGHIVAEAAAFLSFLIYSELKDDSILNRIVPSFVDRCEGRAEQGSGSMVRKTGGLVDLARDAIGTAGAGSEAATSLLKDIAGMKEARPMRATFDAVVLSLLGQ